MTGTTAIIVAAGLGTRAGGDRPKQWQRLAGRPVLDWTLDAFRQAPGVDRIVLVLHPQDMHRAADYADARAVPGGASRSASVRAGLAAVPAGVAKVLIHDAARPLVSQRIIADVLSALDLAAGAAPALEVTDALWNGTDGVVTGTTDRSGLFRAQTPQGFRLDAIRAAHAAFTGTAAADDVEVARANGVDVVMVPGEERNLKLTHAPDFRRAEAFLGATMDIRLGNGFDVHRFGKGDAVTLCGVTVPHDRALMGHSDADVGLHAATDAIYGALAMGDIGRHFPPSDPRWSGADSAVFLQHAVKLAAARGYRIGNIDLTLICERPKIGPHAAEMTVRMAEIMDVDPGRVSIKATTTERLGFTGREEGIAAMATALLTGR